MSLRLISFVCFCFTIYSCQKSNNDLRKLERPQLLAFFQQGKQLDFENVLIVDEFGNNISLDSLIILEKQGEHFEDLYQDASGNIKKLKLRKKSYQSFVVACADADSLYQQIYFSDQEQRTGKHIFPEPEKDHQNLMKTLSIINQCGIPNNARDVKTFFLVIQHAPAKYRKEYYSTFEQYVNEGLLNKSSLVLMEDRLLLDLGLPQKYGTQVLTDTANGGWKLDSIAEICSVNTRRKAVGLEPIEQYAKRFNIDFSVPECK